jgi:hypothetical protein
MSILLVAVWLFSAVEIGLSQVTLPTTLEASVIGGSALMVKDKVAIIGSVDYERNGLTGSGECWCCMTTVNSSHTLRRRGLHL